jgi:hypothetical protein
MISYITCLSFLSPLCMEEKLNEKRFDFEIDLLSFCIINFRAVKFVYNLPAKWFVLFEVFVRTNKSRFKFELTCHVCWISMKI